MVNTRIFIKPSWPSDEIDGIVANYKVAEAIAEPTAEARLRGMRVELQNNMLGFPSEFIDQQGWLNFFRSHDEYQLPPSWVLAWTLCDYDARIQLGVRMSMSSSVVQVDKDNGLAHIVHSVKLDANEWGHRSRPLKKPSVYSDGLVRTEGGQLAFDDNYGIAFTLPLNETPFESMPLEKFIADYSRAASRMLLMNNEQLDSFCKITKKGEYVAEDSPVISTWPVAIGICSGAKGEYTSINLEQKIRFNGCRAYGIKFLKKQIEERESIE